MPATIPSRDNHMAVPPPQPPLLYTPHFCLRGEPQSPGGARDGRRRVAPTVGTVHYEL